MKSLIFLAIVLAIAAAEPGIKQDKHKPPYINRPHPPRGGGYRFRRSPEPEPQGSIVLEAQKPLGGPERRPTVSLDYEHKIWEGKNGHVSASGGAVKYPGERVQPQIGFEGTWRFRRSPEPEPQGSIVLQGQKPLSGPDRRPTVSLDYQHKIWEGKNGHVSASGGAVKYPGQRVQPQIGIQGSWRFRRSPEPEPQGSIHAHGTQHTTGRDPQKQWNVDYEHKIWGNKDGGISVVAGAQKQPGHHSEGHAGIQGSIKWRRSASPEPQGSIHAHGTQHTTGRDPQKQWNVDYEHKVWGNKDGSISVVAGAQKQPGHHSEGHAGIQGSIHW